MSVIIDIVILVIIGAFVWRGYRNGIVRGILGILALIIAISIGNFVAAKYSNEFTGMLKPFVLGVTEKSMSEVLGTVQPKEGEPVVEIAEGDKKDVYIVSYSMLRNIGVSEKAAERIAEGAKAKNGSVDYNLANYISAEVSGLISHAVMFVVAFIMVMIVAVVIGNLIDISFVIPKTEHIDPYVGAGLGLIIAIIALFAFLSVFRYAGLLIPAEVLKKTILFEMFINNNPVASVIGV